MTTKPARRVNAQWLWLILPAFLVGAFYEYVVLDAKDPYWGRDYNDGFNDGWESAQPNNPDYGYGILPVIGILVPIVLLFGLVGLVLRVYRKRKETAP